MIDLDRLRLSVAADPRLRYVARRIVDRLVGVSRTAPPGLGGVRPGGSEGDVDTVVVVLAAAEDAALAATLADLRTLTLRHGALRVVLVVQGRHLPAVRQGGLLVEHLLTEGEWGGDNHGQTWPDYLRERLDTVREDYAACAVLPLGASGTAGLPVDLLLAALPRQRPGRLPRWWRSRLVALERALDAPAP